MSVVLKMKYQEEVRRIKLATEQIKYEDVLKLIREAWPEEVITEEVISSLKYLDDDGDLCTLCCATFPDFLDGHEISGRKVLKLQLSTNLVEEPPDQCLQEGHAPCTVCLWRLPPGPLP